MAYPKIRILLLLVTLLIKTSSIFSISSYNEIKMHITNIHKGSDRKNVNKLLHELPLVIPTVSEKQVEEILQILQEKISMFPYEITEFIRKNPQVYKKSNIPYLTLAIGNPITIENYLSSSKETIVLFSAEWCVQCQHVKPKLKQMAKESNFLLREIDILDWDSEACDMLKNYLPANKKPYLPFILTNP